MKPYLPALLLLLATLSSGCGILVGNVKPLTERSARYLIQPPEPRSEWKALPKTGNLDTGDVSDFGFQSKKTDSVISVSSSCRERIQKENETLSEYTDLLLLGMTRLTNRQERSIQVDQTDALETTVSGTVQEEKPLVIQSIVVKREHCIYDLMLLSKPESFEAERPVFVKFVSSFQFLKQ